MRNPFPLVYIQTATSTSNERNTLEIVKSRKHDFQISNSNSNFVPDPIFSARSNCERWKIKLKTVSYRAFDFLEDPFRVEGVSRRKKRKFGWRACKMRSTIPPFPPASKERREGYHESLLQRLVIQREGCQLGKVARCPVMRRARHPDDEAPALYTPDMRASTTTHNANKLHTI